jgi:hypothetical protein
MTTLTRCLVLLAVFASTGLGAKERNAVVIQADFGGAVMPGVVFAVDKDIPIFTVQPLIELYNIDAAARNLIYTAPVWPAGTVFVSVVDPGVGTKRKSVVLKTKNGQYFVTPDNGTLSYVAQELGIEAVREIDETVNRRPGTEWSHVSRARRLRLHGGAARGGRDFLRAGRAVAGAEGRDLGNAKACGERWRRDRDDRQLAWASRQHDLPDRPAHV